MKRNRNVKHKTYAPNYINLICLTSDLLPNSLIRTKKPSFHVNAIEELKLTPMGYAL